MDVSVSFVMERHGRPGLTHHLLVGQTVNQTLKKDGWMDGYLPMITSKKTAPTVTANMANVFIVTYYNYEISMFKYHKQNKFCFV